MSYSDFVFAVHHGFVGLLISWLVMVPAAMEPLDVQRGTAHIDRGLTEISSATSVTAGPSPAARSRGEGGATAHARYAGGADGDDADPVAIHTGSSGLMPTVGATITASIAG